MDFPWSYWLLAAAVINIAGAYSLRGTGSRAKFLPFAMSLGGFAVLPLSPIAFDLLHWFAIFPLVCVAIAILPSLASRKIWRVGAISALLAVSLFQTSRTLGYFGRERDSLIQHGAGPNVPLESSWVALDLCRWISRQPGGMEISTGEGIGTFLTYCSTGTISRFPRPPFDLHSIIRQYGESTAHYVCINGAPVGYSTAYGYEYYIDIRDPDAVSKADDPRTRRAGDCALLIAETKRAHRLLREAKTFFAPDGIHGFTVYAPVPAAAH